jgi:Spy/CpxP family protein refolding chaperone
MKSSNRWIVAAGLALVFAAGVVCGSVTTLHVVRSNLARAGDCRNWSADAMRDLQSRLNLTSEQHQKIEKMVEASGSEIKDEFDKTFYSLGRELVRLQHGIDAELTPEQRKIHADMKKELRKDLKEKMNLTLPED